MPSGSLKMFIGVPVSGESAHCVFVPEDEEQCRRKRNSAEQRKQIPQIQSQPQHCGKPQKEDGRRTEIRFRQNTSAEENPGCRHPQKTFPLRKLLRSIKRERQQKRTLCEFGGLKQKRSDGEPALHAVDSGSPEQHEQESGKRDPRKPFCRTFPEIE